MAGIINNAQAQQQKPNPTDVDRIVIAAKRVIARVAPQLLQMMRSSQDPATGLAHAFLLLMKQLYAKSKGTMPIQAILPATKEIIQDVARVGETGGLFKVTPQLLQQALQLASQQGKQAPQGQQPQGQQPGVAVPPAAAPAPQPAGV